MLYLGAKWPSNQNVLIAHRILAEPGPQPGFTVWGEKYTFRGERFLFLACVQKQIFLSTTNVGNKKYNFPRIPPVSASQGRTVARKSSIGGVHVCAGG